MDNENIENTISLLHENSLIDLMHSTPLERKVQENLWDYHNRLVKNSDEYKNANFYERKDFILSLLNPYLIPSEISEDRKFNTSVIRYMSSVVSLLSAGSGFYFVYNNIADGSASMVFAIAAISTSICVVPSVKKMMFRSSLSSKNLKRHSYNINKLLEVLIRDKAETAKFFDNSEILGYALWLSEKSLFFVSDGKVSRSVLKSLNYGKFMNDSLYVSFMNLAKDMNSQKSHITKQNIPYNVGFPNTSNKGDIDNDFLIYENYPEIFSARTFGFQVADKQAESLNELESNFERVESFDLELLNLEKIENEWLVSQTDIVQLLKYPMLADMSEPSVKEFYRHLSYAKLLASKKLTAEFSLAVSSLDASWSSLLYEAKKARLSKFDDGERKKILAATNLMNIALNEASTPSERQSAYKKAMNHLEGLIVIPESALSILEESVSRLEILGLKSD